MSDQLDLDDLATTERDTGDGPSRRTFLTLAETSLALASTPACTRQPWELIVPYVHPPTESLLETPLYYATAMTTAGIATGLVVESYRGRPTKVEGNPDHPASLGASDASMQASVLSLYHPDRSQSPSKNGSIDTWASFANELSARTNARNKGAGFRILTGTVTSPTLAAQIREFLALNPHAQWHQWEPCGRHFQRAGSMAAFGQYWNTVYRFDQADRVVSLDADFMAPTMPGNLRYTRDYMARRRAAAEDPSLAAPRLYMAESGQSITGGIADHRLRMRASDVESFASALLSGEGEPALGRDLEQHHGRSIVIAGEFQPARVHAAAHALNAKLGNVGNTVIHTEPVEAYPMDEVASIASLVEDMRSGAVNSLLILGGNPAYDSPAHLNFKEALQNVNWSAHAGQYSNETARACRWHIPEAHFLESWSDARAWDGTASIVQPLIHPLYHGRTFHDVLNVLNRQATRSSVENIRGFWKAQHRGTDFEDFWQTSLEDGVVSGSAFVEKRPPEPRVPVAPPVLAGTGLDVVFGFGSGDWRGRVREPA
jgi:molybdopterin-containing oxidoreductase family iron-sulfur binding subunit